MNKWFNKQTIISFILGAILFSSVSVFATTQLNVVPNPFPIIVNGKTSDIEGYNIEGRTYLQLRDTAEILNVDLDFKNNKIYINNDEGNNIQETPTPVAISTPVPTNIDIDINNESEVDEMESTITNKTIDGIKIYTYDTELQKYSASGNQYIKLVHVLNIYKPYGYDIEVKDNIGTLIKKDDTTKTILLQNIPLEDIDYFTMIKYDYYIENILPLLTKEDI